MHIRLLCCPNFENSNYKGFYGAEWSQTFLHITIPIIKSCIDHLHRNSSIHVTIFARKGWIIKRKISTKITYLHHKIATWTPLKVDIPWCFYQRISLDLWLYIKVQNWLLSFPIKGPLSQVKNSKDRGSLHRRRKKKAEEGQVGI